MIQSPSLTVQQHRFRRQPGNLAAQTLAELTADLLQDDLGESLYQRVLERAVATLPGITCGSIVVRTGGRYAFVAAVHHDLPLLRQVTFTEEELYLGESASRANVQADVYQRNVTDLDEARTRLLQAAAAPDRPVRGTLVVPVRVRGQTAAVLYLDSPHPDTWLARQVPAASLFGSQVGLVLQRLYLQQDAQAVRRELALLDTVRALLVQSAQAAPITGQMLEAVRQACAGVAAGILLLGQPLPWSAFSGVADQACLAAWQVLAAQATASGELAVSGAAVALPLRGVAGLIGALTIQLPQTASPAELRLLDAVAAHLGAALDREQMVRQQARDSEAMQHLYLTADRQRRELELLHEVRSALETVTSRAELLQTVTAVIAGTFGYIQVSAYLVEGDQLVLQSDRGYATVLRQVPLDRGVMGRVVRSAAAAYLPDVSADPDFIGAIENISSEVCLPLRSRGRVIGVLNIESVHPAQLTSEDLRVLEAVCAYINQGLERVDLLTRTRSSETRYRLLAENMGDLLCLHDLAGNYRYLSPSLQWQLGLDPASLVGRPGDALLHPDDVSLAQTLLATVMTGERPAALRVRLRHADGHYLWFESTVSPVLVDDQIQSVLSASRNVHERVQMEEQLVIQANHDALTGLPNRAYFEQQLRRCAAQGGPHTVLFMDVDRFKVLNDSLGHRAGDALLRQLARCLQQCLRPGQVLARFGGDEFAVLLSAGQAAHAEALAQRIEAALVQPFVIESREWQVSVSIGIATSGPGEPDLLRDADLAMYAAKRQRDGGYVVYDAGLHAAALRKLQVEEALARAVRRGDLRAVFQPIVCLARGTVLGFETLTRWTDPVLGPVSPAEFIPVAEETGLIHEIGAFALGQALAAQRFWAQDPATGGLRISVNVSPQQFRRPGLAQLIVQVAAAVGGDPARLNVEITEGTIMENPAEASVVLAELRALGIQVQIDDFGTGHSSLASLHRFPIDALKIDRAFVARLGEDEISDSIVRTVVLLAQSLGLPAVAEGVETLAQQQHLQALGCAAAQGYRYAPGLSQAEATAWLSEAGNAAWWSAGSGPAGSSGTFSVTPVSG